MRVVQLISSLKGRGAERACVELHKGFLRAGYDARIYITHDLVEYDLDRSRVECLSPDEVRARLSEEPFDLLIGHMTHAAKVLRGMKRDPRLFFVVHTTLSAKLKQMPPKRRLIEYAKLQMIYRGAQVVSVSDWAARDLREKLRIVPRRLRTIYNPFDIRRIRRLGAEPCPEESPFIVAVGSLHRVKRYDRLLEAYARLQTTHRLVILGRGPEEEALRKLAGELGIVERVRFIGWVENPYAWIRKAELLVLSSDIEGLPSVVIEALILGTPVVATDCPSGIREIMRGTLAKYLVPTDDLSALTEAMRRALVNYPGLLEKDLTKFDSNIVVQSYVNLVESRGARK